MNSVLLMTLLLTFSTGLKSPGLAEGQRALKRRDPAKARTHLERCIKKEPENTKCLWELGWAYRVLGESEQAVVVWDKVLALEPTHPDVRDHLARVKDELTLKASLNDMGDVTPAVGDATKRLRLRAVGDVMMGTDFPEGHLSPADGADVMREVSALLADADLSFVNLEGPLCDHGETRKCKPGQNCYAFRSPTKYGQFLVDAGVDLASTANNHSGDFGEICRAETEQILSKHQIAWSGRTGSVAVVEKNGVRVSMIGFHTGDGVNPVNDIEVATKLVQKAAANSDVVIVSFHGGAEGAKAQHVPVGKEEFYGEDRGDLRVFTHAVVDAGADLVFGHGPHVLRGVEIYNDRLIAYSLGNFATYGRFNLSGPLGVGMILDVEIDGTGKFMGGKVIPTKQINGGMAVPDADGAAITTIRTLSREDFAATAVVVDDDGTLRGPALK